MATVSISKQLLTKVLSSYIILTFIVAAVQLGYTYVTVKNQIIEDLKQLEQTINVSLTQAVWDISDIQVSAIGQGIAAMSLVRAVIITEESHQVMYQSGELDGFDTKKFLTPSSTTLQHNDLFGYSTSLIYDFSSNSSFGSSNTIGHIAIFSSDELVFQKVGAQMLFPVIGAVFSIILLSFLIKRLFRNLLTTPLETLSHGIARIDLENLGQARLNPPSSQQDELTTLANSFNLMLVKLEEYNASLEQTKLKLVNANQQLDRQNVYLEQEVTKKTANLSQAITELAQQKNELEESEQELLASLTQLKETQTQLVQSEKMASLGSLVAGISHEINTPVGIGVTAVSYLSECVRTLDEKINDKTLTQKYMTKFIEDANSGCALLTTNLNKASQLIQSFKDIAVDQTSEAVRDVNIHQYLHEVITSLQPKLKRTQHKIEIEGADDIVIHCRAGALSQVFTNMILNSLIHAFDKVEQGVMTFKLKHDDEHVFIEYHDNGSGINQESLDLLFEPFFTTKRGQGGSGLGTHILYNIVTQSLHGEIYATSELGHGLNYFIKFPKPKGIVEQELEQQGKGINKKEA
ncbi:ATP-binding protein [Psychrobium sp. 1_MG-2023]|uniref:ATP-binding protein n=1 Tax=Psychrobium sp. 1_MG-2023 TaxID=3062624 RepID=UPI000C339812|nr:ATP-binding protein [Psychrobium sp. 1_MG-2023]MDP2560924.1 ATP-binding protein [Psychrobium sp. 1_MG-2023]PKF55998.1 ATP-binding protein [Alteromonadales bacterium alter-6D02]